MNSTQKVLWKECWISRVHFSKKKSLLENSANPSQQCPEPSFDESGKEHYYPNTNFHNLGLFLTCNSLPGRAFQKAFQVKRKGLAANLHCALQCARPGTKGGADTPLPHTHEAGLLVWLPHKSTVFRLCNLPQASHENATTHVLWSALQSAYLRADFCDTIAV